jgi:hypothetical protein
MAQLKTTLNSLRFDSTAPLTLTDKRDWGRAWDLMGDLLATECKIQRKSLSKTVRSLISDEKIPGSSRRAIASKS